MKRRLKVTLNGTNENLYNPLGLTQNPFPQMGDWEGRLADAMLNDLAAEPVKDKNDLRRRLKGCTKEFIDLCISQFKPGARISFYVTFEDNR